MHAMCLGIEPSLVICLGSSSWARTNDTAVNSRMLYLLSYEGIYKWVRGQDSNLRPLAYEANEIPLLHPAVYENL